MKEQHEYTNWQHHFEDCEACTADKPCTYGQRLKYMETWREKKAKR